MLKEYKRKTNIGIGVGLALFVTNPVLSAIYGRQFLETRLGIFSALAIQLMAFGWFIWGCTCYAKAKGRDLAFGFLGIFSIFGLFILVCLRDHYPNGRPSDDTDHGRGFPVGPVQPPMADAALKDPPPKA
jgi:hypothetical protein